MKSKLFQLITIIGFGMTPLIVTILLAQPLAIAQTGTDLTVDLFTASSYSLTIDDPITFSVRIRNAGDTTVPGRRIYLYVDPSDQPPLSSTVETKPFVAAIEWPPGDVQVVQLANYNFTTPGEHVIYAWVDPLERIDEINEENNLKKVQVYVAQTDADSFEPDDACTQAKLITTNGIPQQRQFALTNDADDEDWVKASLTAGTVYTFTVQGLGTQAHPEFEIWNSCDEPPPNFGTTFRQVITAPQTGDIFLRISNSLSDYDADQTTYQLFVQASSAGGQSPTITNVSPSQALNDQQTTLTIKGDYFDFPPTIKLCEYAQQQCGECTQLPPSQINFIDSTQLEGVLLSNMPPGEYCVSVTNPGGKQSMLNNAFTLNATKPVISQILPSQGQNTLPTEINLYGQRLFLGRSSFSVKLGNISITDLAEVSPGTHIRATVPPGLPGGTYNITAAYNGTELTTLPAAFTVLEDSQDDLYVQSQELWIYPAPQVGKKSEIGLTVHRRGGDETLTDISVKFTANGQELGTNKVPFLISNGSSNVGQLSWYPSQTGQFVIKAIVDPTGEISEATKTNNVVSQTVTVKTPTSDQQAPLVNTITIKDPQQQPIRSTNQRLVYLASSTSDAFGGSGVTSLRFLEFEFNQASLLWVPVWDSNWVPVTVVNENYYQHQLTPSGGVHYLQVWARDRDGNISIYPLQDTLNYIPTIDTVQTGQSRIYRQTLSQGESFTVQLTSLQGDADLYVWAPDYQSGRPPWVSNLNDSSDQITFSAPISGEYQIEVSGHAGGQYGLTFIQGASVGSLATSHDVGSQDSTKVVPSAPVIPLVSQPSANLAILNVDTHHLTFSAAVSDADPITQTVGIFNTDVATFTWSATKNADWFDLSNTNNTAPAVLTVSVNPSGLAEGIYTDTITITSDEAINSPQTIKVTLKVGSQAVYLPLIVK